LIMCLSCIVFAHLLIDGAQLFSVGKSVLLSFRFRRSAGAEIGASGLE
jgi:hypothetical protein